MALDLVSSESGSVFLGNPHFPPLKLSAFEAAGFPIGAKLVGEALEPWLSVRAWFQEKAECEALGVDFTLGPLSPLRHYEECFRKTRDSVAVDELMAMSDPVAIAAYDALVDEFNARLGEISIEEVAEYVRRASAIILPPSRLHWFEQSEFAHGARVTRDFFNPWATIKIWLEEKAECEALGEAFTLGPLLPLRHYEERYRETRDAVAVDELIAMSDPTAVAAIDALVDDFNVWLSEISGNRFAEEAMHYVRRAKEIIYSASRLNEFDREHFARGAKLARFSFDPWESIGLLLQEQAECEAFEIASTLGSFLPLKHYEAYCRGLRDAAEADELMARSDPVAIAAYDTLVDAFNTRWGEVLINQLIEEARGYAWRAYALNFMR